jgi:prolipoprotein diacylglyceryl transferase
VLRPASLPSPPLDWRQFELGTWIHSWLPVWPAAWDLTIHTYAICILVGIIAAVLIANVRLTERGGERWIVLDVAIGAVIGGIVGARFFHVITHPGDFFPFDAAHPAWKVLAVWEGGVAYYGALLGGALGVFIACRIVGLRTWAVLDAIAPGMLIAQAFGRLGNYFNHELYGLPTTLPWGLQIESSNSAYPAGLPDGTLFTPTFLYEIVWNVIGFVVIIAVDRRLKLQWGKMLGLYLIWQGLGRSYFESIRVDPSEYYFGIRANVWAAIGAIVLGLIIIWVQSRRHPGQEPSIYRPGHEYVPDAAVDSADTYPDTEDPEDEVPTESEVGAGAAKPATSGAPAS